MYSKSLMTRFLSLQWVLSIIGPLMLCIASGTTYGESDLKQYGRFWESLKSEWAGERTHHQSELDALNKSHAPDRVQRIEQENKHHLEASKSLAQRRADIQEAIIQEVNRRTANGTAETSAPARKTAGTDAAGPEGRGMAGDADYGSGSRTADKVKAVLNDMGIKADIKSTASTVEIGSDLNMTFNKEGRLGPSGSAAQQTQATVDARNKETYLSETMDKTQPGRDFVQVQDHKKKARDGLNSDPAELAADPSKAQDMIKGADKTLKHLKDEDLAEIMRNHNVEGDPQNFRKRMDALKQGRVNVTPDNVAELQQISQDIFEKAEAKTWNQALDDVANTNNKISQLETTGNRAEAQRLREQLVDSRIKIGEYQTATKSDPSWGKLRKAAEVVGKGDIALDILAGAQDVKEAIIEGDMEKLRNKGLETADALAGSPVATGKMVWQRLGPNREETNKAIQQANDNAAEADAMQIQVDLLRGRLDRNEINRIMDAHERGDDTLAKAAYQRIGKEMPKPTVPTTVTNETLTAWGGEVWENWTEVWQGNKERVKKASDFIKETAQDVSEIGGGLTDREVAGELVEQQKKNLSSGNLIEGWNLIKEKTQELLGRKPTDAEREKAAIKNLADLYVARGADPVEANKIAEDQIMHRSAPETQQAVKNLKDKLGASSKSKDKIIDPTAIPPSKADTNNSKEIKPVVKKDPAYYFNGSASEIWMGETTPNIISLSRKRLYGPRRDSWGCEVDHAERSTAHLDANLVAHFTDRESFHSLEDIRKALEEAVATAGGKLAPIALGDFNGFMHTVDQAFKKPTGGCNSGFYSGGLGFTGTGYVIKDGVVVKLHYEVTGTGGVDGFFQAGSDQPWLEHFGPAIRDETKSILLGLQLKYKANFLKTPYSGPALDGSEWPRVKLLASVPPPYVPGQKVVVSTVVENPDPDNPPVSYIWTGSVGGSATSLAHVDSSPLDLSKPGRQKVGVEIIGQDYAIGSASLEFDVAEVKVSIERTDALPLVAGRPLGLTARLKVANGPASEGDYIYRWQPHPEVSFSTLDSTSADTRATFAQAGTYKVWVDILQRQGGILNTVTASQPLELKVNAAPETAPTVQMDAERERSKQARGGYQLYFDGKLVSSPDAAGYTSEQAKENCAFNLKTKPNTAIKCVFNGQVFEQRHPEKPLTGSGYQLYFDGKLVSGPDAAGYTSEQAKENCAFNLKTKPNTTIKCVFNGQVFEQWNPEKPSGSGEQLDSYGKPTPVYDNGNTGGCSLTDTAAFALKEPVKVTQIVAWYNWAANESGVGYKLLDSTGKQLRSATMVRGGCDPYQKSWCSAVDEPNIYLPAGAYTAKLAKASMCQNAGSGGNGMVKIIAGGLLVTPQKSPAPLSTPSPVSETNILGSKTITVVFVNNDVQNVHIFTDGDKFGLGNRLMPGESRQVSMAMPAGGRIKFISGRGGKVISTALWNENLDDTNRIPKVIFNKNQMLTVSTDLR